MNTRDPSRSVKGASRVLSTPGSGGPGMLSGMRYPDGGTCGTGCTAAVVVFDVDGGV